jgi:PBP1b-binding outer membrane lipoprotein LpoB
MKMKSVLTISTVTLLLLFSGCTSTKKTQAEQAQKNKETMDSWLKHHKSELIRSWGPPTRYDSDGQGGEILIYEYKRTVGAVINGNYLQRTFVDYKEMFANRDGVIYYWRTGTR